MKLCVIGAGGAAGLCAVKNGIEFGFEVTAFEKTDQVGGLWVYTDEVGKDKNGLDVHSSMYQGLHTNLPKEIMGYPTVPFPDGEESYIPSQEVLKYYQSYADELDLRRHIKFEHNVLRVIPLADESWEVIVQDMTTEKYETFTFDNVLVCNGHNSTPNMPKFKGQKTFLGRKIHSHDYRSGKSFTGENVLIVGAGPSGVDCVIDTAKLANLVTWSHHLKKSPNGNYGANVNQKPDVQEMTKNGVIFTDGSHQEFTSIIFCTGFKYTFPFLSVDCGIKCESNYVRPLYKHCININHPTMGLIGLPNFICPNQMVDLQVRFCLTFMNGRKKLPSKHEMLLDTKKEMKERFERSIFKDKAHFLGPALQDIYFSDLAAIAEIAPIKPIIRKMFAKGISNLLQDYKNFRNEIFKVIDDDNFVIISKKHYSC